MGSRYQPYTAYLREQFGVTFTQVELANSENQPVVIGLDEEESGDPGPATLVIEYSQFNQHGVQENFLDEGAHQFSVYPGQFPVYYLLSQSFHQLLNRIIFSGKPVNAHLINPLSPDSSAPFHLQLNRTGHIYTVTAFPINDQGLIQFTNSTMLFHHAGGLNWSYNIDQQLITLEARLLFYRLGLFKLSRTRITAMLLRLFSAQSSISKL